MPQTEKTDGSKTKKVVREIQGYAIAIISAVIVAVLTRVFIIEPFIVPTPSMEPTLIVDDKVIINKLAYKFTAVKRGDIIAFHSNTEDDKELVKRAIAVEGDTVMLTSEGEVFVNGEKAEEDYLPVGMTLSYLNQELTLGKNEIFVM